MYPTDQKITAHKSDPQIEFAQSVLALLDQRGWAAMSKKEMCLELIYAAHSAGLLDLNVNRFLLADRLRMAPASVDTLKRDLYLFKGLGKTSTEGLLRYLQTNDQTTAVDAKEGKIVFALQDAAIRQQFEALLAELGVTADYRLNRTLLVLDSIRFLIAVRRQKQTDITELLEALQRACPHVRASIAKTGGAKENWTHILKQGLTAATVHVLGDAGAEISQELVTFAFAALRELAQ